MILIDTNVLVALTNGRDKNHQRCVTWYESNTAAFTLVPA